MQTIGYADPPPTRTPTGSALKTICPLPPTPPPTPTPQYGLRDIITHRPCGLAQREAIGHSRISKTVVMRDQCIPLLFRLNAHAIKEIEFSCRTNSKTRGSFKSAHAWISFKLCMLLIQGPAIIKMALFSR